MDDETVDVGPVTVGPTLPRQKTEPPIHVLLAAIDEALRTPTYRSDANLAFLKLCDRLHIDPGALKYERGWTKKYIT